MKRTLLLVIFVLALLNLNPKGLADPSGLAHAQTGGGPSTPLGTGYDLTWNTIDGGGESSSGSGYTLAGTLGQPDAGAAMSGGGYTLVGGFWGGAGPADAPARYSIYLPLVIK